MTTFTPYPLDAVVTTFAQYTDDPRLPPGMIFPNHGDQILSTAVTLLGLTVLTYCFARRSDYDGVWTLRGLRELPWPRLCVMLMFMDSWAFIFTTGMLVNGAGLSANNLHCSLAIFSCIILYVISKLLIYLFLTEKVYIVWAPHGTGRPTKRLKTPVFIVCITMISFLAVIFCVLIWGRVAELRAADRVCIIGLTRAASLTLLSYDLMTTIVLTTLFVWPLFTSNVGHRVRKVASRTLVASVAALVTSCINIIVLTLLHGKELGWVCLASCGTDVSINAMAIYWVTSTSHTSRPMKDSNTPHGPIANNGGPSVKSGSAGEPSGGDNVTGGHGRSIRISSSNNKYLPHTVSHASAHAVQDLQVVGGAVPANLSSSRVTHFAEPMASVARSASHGPHGSEGEKTSSTSQRVERKKGWLGGMIDAIKGAKETDVEEHTMSVQVTVTTEHVMPRVDEEDIKYPPSESDDYDYPTSDSSKPSRLHHAV